MHLMATHKKKIRRKRNANNNTDDDIPRSMAGAYPGIHWNKEEDRMEDREL
jgi:hypothetical protein